MEESSLLPPVVLVHRPPALDFIDEHLSRHSFTALYTHTSLEDSLQDFLSSHAASVRAVVSLGRLPIPAEFISNLPSLEIVVCASVGFDHVDLDECRRRGVVITNAGDAYGEDVADLAVGLLISVIRRIAAVDRYVRSGQWTRLWDYPLGFKLNRKKVGIVGLGSIGSLVAKRLEPFGCIISYNSRNPKPDVPYAYYSNILSLAADNDFLILCCSLTDETHHIVNREVMETLGKNGVIINIGRGGLIDEKEMVKCLVNGVIWGVGLDVFENEPEVPEELFGLENVVLSPHAAGMTAESLNNISEVAIANLKAFFADQPLMFTVQLD
ncbi:PREDICTED: glyoxylate/hydroxypyruvate reductase HPR3-like [Camelina sativa]|uniref:Glyoxylate/hydroxypyruvate reductase HPR3-like n=1 Tax=Camelina sativa TaxID=90675 RepID=A0ABM0WU71_CAMSA|nr:PREDICTED: glyoxylate/hydroxypyruvate reductase HPR3-like [Camelina sativa]